MNLKSPVGTAAMLALRSGSLASRDVEAGSTVIIQNLLSRKHLNGCMGTIVPHIDGTLDGMEGRHRYVQIHGTEHTIRVLPENLERYPYNDVFSRPREARALSLTSSIRRTARDLSSLDADHTGLAQRERELALDRTVPEQGTEHRYAKHFAEVTLDVVEEQTFRKRREEEVGPRNVHLRLNALGYVMIPPHIEENGPGEMMIQRWTGHPKVDRSLFIVDHQIESSVRATKDISSQRHIPALRAVAGKKNFGAKPGPAPFDNSFRSTVLNKNRQTVFTKFGRGAMDALPLTCEGENVQPVKLNLACKWR